MNSRTFSHHPPSKTNTADGRQKSTAHRGASHAFSLAFPASNLSEAYIGTNGALAAATTAGMGMRGITSNGPQEERPPTKTAQMSGASEKAGSSRDQSPSYAAALHATSKVTPARTLRSDHSTPSSRRPSPLEMCADRSINAPPIVPHSTDQAVGATRSLVSLFESKEKVPITQSVRYVTRPASAIASPTPVKPPIRPTLSTDNSLSTFPLGVELGKSFTASGPSITKKASAATTTAQPVGWISESTHSTPSPRTRRFGAQGPLDASLENGTNLPRISKRKAPLAISRAERAEPSTALQQKSLSGSTSKLFSAPPSHPLLPAKPSRSFEMKVNSMADTIVAASLASSRAPSPTNTPPPPTRRQKSHSLFHNSQGQTGRTPSPAKVMRQTMREALLVDDDMEYKKKSILARKHVHKHHEGDRKRYRATVTERERRRYDGVWAANKGLLMDADSSDSVLNLVVRDIWSRSRLPNDVLAEIWDLVDIHERDRLRRSEFVVGMWLIDQRLKGRKLPSIVSQSLWTSVQLLHGVKVFQHQH